MQEAHMGFTRSCRGFRRSFPHPSALRRTRDVIAIAAAVTRMAQRQRMTTCARARARHGWSAVSMRSGCKGLGTEHSAMSCGV